MVEALFGQKDAGQYVVVIELKDPTKAGQDVLARQVVADFEIVDESTFLWDNKRLNEISKAAWNGELISKIRVDAKTNKLLVSLQVYKSNKSVAGANIIDAAVDTYNKATKIIGFAPFSAEVKEGWVAVQSFASKIIENFQTADLPRFFGPRLS